MGQKAPENLPITDLYLMPANRITGIVAGNRKQSPENAARDAIVAWIHSRDPSVDMRGMYLTMHRKNPENQTVETLRLIDGKIQWVKA